MEKKIKTAAICFFGQARMLDLCYPYIKKNLLDPIGKNGKDYDIFCCVEDDEDLRNATASFLVDFFQNVDSPGGGAQLNQRMEQTGDKRSRYLLPVIYFDGELMYSPEVVAVVTEYKYK